MNKPAPDNASAVLIVSTNRGDRRGLFDALDRHGYKSVFSAERLDQARETLENQPDIGVVFLDLRLDAEDLTLFCREAARNHGTILIGVIPGEIDEDFHWDWHTLPADVSDCIQSPVQPDEAIYRLKRLAPGSSAMLVDPAAGKAYTAFFEQIQDGVLLLDVNNLEMLEANPAFLERCNYAMADLSGKRFLDLDKSHDETQGEELLKTLKREGRIQFRCRLRTGGDGYYPADVTLQLGVFGEQVRYVAILRDLSIQQQTERALSLIAASFDTRLESKYLNRLAAQAVTWLEADYFLIGLQTGKDQQLKVHALYCSSSIKDDLENDVSTGLAKRVLSGETIGLRQGAWNDPKISDRFVVENSIESWLGIPLVERTNQVSGLLVAASRKPIRQWSLACATLKILAERFAMELQTKRFFEDTRSQGLRDALTRLPNRLLFEDRLYSTLKESQRTGEMFATLFVDLDRFKTINDSFGHDVGDQVLRGVARRLSSSIRASDTVARYAGDEFTIVLRHVIQREDVFRIAKKLNQLLAEPLQLPDGKEISCTASIGVSFYPDDGDAGAELIKHADQAMYNAKGLGRNTFQTYVSAGEESQQQKILLEAKLRKAQENNELRVYFQPQVETESEDIVGMEALIRWQHPELGLISPGFFIPLAEESGLIVPMGEWLLNEACRWAKSWCDRFGLQLRLGVNLSALQLKQPGIVETIRRALETSKLPAHLLDLEVTESMSLKDVSNLLEILQRLRKLGCTISIDDFGTGQSSLDYIKRFPADRIKIDQSFVRNIGVDPDDVAIVEATIAMAHNLKRLVVAEGVEEEQQLEFLRKLQCEEVQGYLFCRPLPPDSFERLLLERQRLMGERAAS